MFREKYPIGAICSLLIVLLLTACNSKLEDTVEYTIEQPGQHTVEPPEPNSPLGPLVMEEAQLLITTKTAVEFGDLEFWKSAGQSAYPILHPRFASVNDFASQMDQYTSVFDFQCQAVLRYPKESNSGDVEDQILSLVFTASGNDSYQEAAETHSVLVPELGVFEVRYLVDENNELAFYLDDAGFIASNGEDLEELYQNFISSRKNRLGDGLLIDPCP